MSKKVSVVVPAYNSSKTIKRCLDSLVNQTLEDIEIIVVNDASTDDTWDIMSEYESRFPDKLIIVNEMVNKGSGGARNVAFDMASGEYIGLVDSDDYVELDMYENLYERARLDNSDIVDCGFFSESTNTAIVFTSDDLTGVLDAQKRSTLIASGGYLVTKIFRRELWNEPQIRMREKIRCLEDSEILTYMFIRAGSISNVKKVMYYYCDVDSSATKEIDLQVYYDSVYGAIEATYKVCHNMDLYGEVREAVEYAMTNMYSCGINRCLYDSIIKNGLSEQKIKKYFNSVGYKERGMLSALAKLKKETILGAYRENKETMNRMNILDVLIMEECDRRYE